MSLTFAWKDPSQLAVRYGLAWSLAGRAGMALIQMLTAPLYLHWLGPAGYAFLALTATLLALMICIDVAVSPPLLNRISSGNAADRGASLRGILAAMEIVWALAALGAFLVVFLAAPPLFAGWRSDAGLSTTGNSSIAILMALAVAANAPILLYSTILVGLQRHGLLTLVRTGGYAVQAIGAVLIAFHGAGLPTFLAWMAVSTSLIGLAIGFAARRALPPARDKIRPDWQAIASFKAQALLGIGVGMTQMLIMHLDKLILAPTVPAAVFGIYGLSFMLAVQIGTLITQPVTSVIHPQFAERLDGSSPESLQDFYLRWTQIVGVLALPPLATLAFFPHALLDLWLGPASAAKPEVANLLPLLLIGSIANAFAVMPIFLCLASGRSGPYLAVNLLAVASNALWLWWAAPRLGTIAGVAGWIATNLAYLMILGPIVHATYKIGPYAKWLLRSVVLPGMAATATLAAAALLFDGLPAGDGLAVRIVRFLAACCIGLLTAALLLALLPLSRNSLAAVARAGQSRRKETSSS